MMKTFAFVTISSLVAGAFAQDSAAEPSPSASGAPAPNPTSTSSLIPTGISAQCSTYLTTLDSAAEVSNCLNRLVEATAAFNPSNQGSATSETLSTALGAICSANCDANKIRGQLAAFYSACQNDLVGESANKDLVTMYDVLYILTPLRNAICSKNPATEKYCVQEIEVIKSGESSGSPGKAVGTSDAPVGSLFVKDETLAALDSEHFGIFKRQEEDDQSPLALLPNTDEYRETGLVYLFVSPTHTPAQLCTACTKEVLSAYVEFEASTPYAMGISQSPILGDQLQLWRNVTEKCGTGFTDEIMALSGVETGNSNTGAPVVSAATVAGVTLGGVLGAVMIGFIGMLF